MGPVLHSSQTPTCPQASDQIRDSHCKRPLQLLGHRPRHGFQWQQRPRTWSQGHHQLLILGCPSLPSSVSLLFLYLSVSLSLHFLHHLLDPFSAWGLSVYTHLKSGLRSTMPCSCIMVQGRAHISGMLCPHRPAWYLTCGSLRLDPFQASRSGGFLEFISNPASLRSSLQVSSALGLLLPCGPGPRWGSSGLWLTPHHGSQSGPAWSSQACFFSGNFRLLIIQMFIGQNTKYRHVLSPLMCM